MHMAEWEGGVCLESKETEKYLVCVNVLFTKILSYYYTSCFFHVNVACINTLSHDYTSYYYIDTWLATFIISIWR